MEEIFKALEQIQSRVELEQSQKKPPQAVKAAATSSLLARYLIDNMDLINFAQSIRYFSNNSIQVLTPEIDDIVLATQDFLPRK